MFLQLLGGILDVNSSYVSVVESLQLSHSFFEFLTLEHPNNNVHNIRLCKQLVYSGSMSHRQLLQLGSADKVGGCGWGGFIHSCGSLVLPASPQVHRLLVSCLQQMEAFLCCSSCMQLLDM